MLKCYTISEGRIIETETDGPILLYINPEESEKRVLVDEFGVDEHTLTSALDPDELSRIEFEPTHTAIIFKRPKNYSARDHFVFKVGSTGLFHFKDKLIIVLAEDLPLFEAKQFQKITTLNEVALRLIYRSIFHFLEHLKIFNMISDELERKINKSMENKYLLNLFTLEKSLVYYLNSINSNAVLIEKLKHNSAKLMLNTEEMEYLDDILVENNQCYRQAEIYSNILASLMDARASIVGNNLNVLMKTLNLITIMIMTPTLVVSVFSMNVPIPLQERTYAFWIILTLALASVGVVMYIWRKNRW
ncbi:MAG: magnesium transporter CorA family protein [bacterium]